MKRILALSAMAACALGAMATPSLADASATSRSNEGEPPPSYSVPLGHEFGWGAPKTQRYTHMQRERAFMGYSGE
jgi:hypothetical protein